MRILFIKSTMNSVNARADFGIGSLSAVLKQHGHDASLFVVRNWDNVPVLVDRIQATKPDMLAFSTYASAFQSTVRVSNVMRKRFPNLLQVMGGIHVILNPEDIQRAPSVDAVCTGEGEYALLDLINNYKQRGSRYLYTKGFWTRQKGRIIKNPTIPFVGDIERLPFPDREIFIEQALSFGDYGAHNPIYLDFIFTRGCPFSCTYCSNHALRRVYGAQGYVRRMSPKRAIEWIRHDLNRYACECISILDDTFTLDKQWTDEFLSLYKTIHMPFVCHLRVGTFDRNTLRKLKGAGCTAVSIGVESGDETFRRNVLKRPIKNADIIQAFHWAKELHLKNGAFVMIGLPGETPNMWLKTVKLLGQISPSRYILNTFYPYPGTELYTRAKKMGYLRHKQRWDFVEGRETVLTMPLFSGNDVMYYRSIINDSVQQATPADNFFTQVQRNVRFTLLSVPPSSPLFPVTHTLRFIDKKTISMLHKMTSIKQNYT